MCVSVKFKLDNFTARVQVDQRSFGQYERQTRVGLSSRANLLATRSIYAVFVINVRVQALSIIGQKNWLRNNERYFKYFLFFLCFFFLFN